MSGEILPAQFDYAGLDAETRIVVQQRTSEIKTIARRAATDVIEIGQKLVEVKERLGPRHFEPWLRAELGWTDNTAYRFIQVFQKFGTSIGPNMGLIAPTALYMLAAPSVPDEARAAALQRAETGERVTVAKAQAIVNEYKPAQPLQATPDELKELAIRWARGISATDPRAVLRQIVLNNTVGISHFERLYEWAGRMLPGKRFMRGELKAAVEAAVAALERPAARVVVLDHESLDHEGAKEAKVPAAGPAKHEEREGAADGEAVDARLERLIDHVYVWLGAPALATMSRADLEKCARLTGSVLDLEGWHARRPGGRNFDWESLMSYLDQKAPELKDGPVQGAVEAVRAKVIERLRQIEDGAEPMEDDRLQNGEPEPEEPEVDAGGIVEAWLEERIEENEMPDDRDAKKMVLRGILTGRTNGFGAHWKSLRAFEEWPEGVGQEAMLEGVRTALAKLTPQTERRPPSWAGVKPAGAATGVQRAYARPVAVDEPGSGRLLKRKNEVIERYIVAGDKALGYLKSLASEREGDEDLREAIAALEAARAEALSVD